MSKRSEYQKHVDFGVDVELGIKSIPQRTVTTKIHEVKVDIKRLRQSVEELGKLYIDGKECISEAQKSDHQRRVQECASRLKGQAQAIIREVKDLQRENTQVERKVQQALQNNDRETLRALVNNNADSINSRRQRISQLLSDLTDIERDVQEIEDNFKLEKRQLVEAQLQDALDRQVSEDELDRVMDTPGALQKIMKDAMISRSGVVLEDTLNQLQVRLDTAKRLEQDVLVLAGMFIEMKNMLVAQGETINIVTKDIEEALKYEKKAIKVLEVAVKYEDTRRKTQVWIIMAVVAVVAVLVLILVLGVFKV